MRNFFQKMNNPVSRSILIHAMAFVAVVAFSVGVALAQGNGGDAGASTSGGATNNPNNYPVLTSSTSGPGAIKANPIGGNNGFNIGNVRIGLPTQVKIGGLRFSFKGDYEGVFEDTACSVLGLGSGKFAALVMAVSGLASIVCAATGAYRMALGTLVVGVGSSILKPVVEQFFGSLCVWGTVYLG